MSENGDSGGDSSGKDGGSRFHLPHLTRRGKIVGLTAAFGVAALTAIFAEEKIYSRLQHIIFGRAAKNAQPKTVPADVKAPTVKAPDGPYDRRNGYTDIDEYSQRLADHGYPLTAYASAEPQSVVGVKIYPPYREKAQTGLRIVTTEGGRPVYTSVFPRKVYKDYDSIPPILAKSLQFAENKELLKDHPPTWNPAVEWDRFARAAAGQAHVIKDKSGGSTLETQRQKYQHSEGGVTKSAGDKITQIFSASAEATLTDSPAQQSTLDYMNSVPFASYPGYGEVNGFADGLEVWFGEDFDNVNRLLLLDQSKLNDEELAQVAKVYREAFSLAMAVKKPSDFLVKHRASLQQRLDSYLPILVKEGIITQRFATAVKAAKVVYADPSHIKAGNIMPDKAVQSMRLELLNLMPVPDGLYGLDRRDIDVTTTEDPGLNRGLATAMDILTDPTRNTAAGFTGYQLLPPGAGKDIHLAATIMERLPDGHSVIRGQMDNFAGPFNINEGSRLQLGSTSKVLTTYSYLDIAEDIYNKYTSDPAKFFSRSFNPNDAIAIWAQGYLSQPGADKSYKGFIHAAMQRKYSGNPGEVFYTAGGQHVFENFERNENFQEYTVEQALVHSVNLCFIRIMRDVENYMIDEKMHIDTGPNGIYRDLDSSLRKTYLERFAAFEGGQFLGRAWQEQSGLSPDQVADMLSTKAGHKPAALAVIYKATHPSGTSEGLKNFIVAHGGGSEKQDFSKYESYGPERYSLNDLIYLTGLKNPFDYWLAAYKTQHPDATRQDAIKAATELRADGSSVVFEMYSWMLEPKNLTDGKIKRQNLNIQTMLEREAFEYIRQQWVRIGYPFDDIVASYASAIGVSGNTPKALGVVMGIVGSGGLRSEPIRFTDFVMARGTPYARYHHIQMADPIRVMSPEIAGELKNAMIGVVEEGTARRAAHSITLDNGHVLTIYGKTGTGDNREGDDVKNRTATFMFNIDDRFYGTVLAYVDGPEAAHYKFTSALAAQLFKIIVNTPEVKEYLNRSYAVSPALKTAANMNSPVANAPRTLDPRTQPR
ncbi:MAG TPA: transglycosylase domain-containing protein [Patescibacteria group bacterium]|nr:transglycosylase domain-containing protein [Patescibacteria group bacterium]